MILFLICNCIIVLFLLVYFVILFIGPPYVPSKNIYSDLEELADIKPRQKFLDIGSGDGRIVFHFAKKNLRSYGIEINPFFVIFSNLYLLLIGKIQNARVHLASLYSYDYSDYDIIYCYLFESTLRDIEEKLTYNKQKDVKIITNTFKFKNIHPTKQLGKLYLYEIKRSN